MADVAAHAVARAGHENELSILGEIGDDALPAAFVDEDAVPQQGGRSVVSLAAIRYWTVLEQTVSANQPPGVSTAEVLRHCATAWGTMYGIARLTAAHKIPAVVDAGRAQLLHEAVEALRDAWQADDAQPQTPPTTPSGTSSTRMPGRNGEVVADPVVASPNANGQPSRQP